MPQLSPQAFERAFPFHLQLDPQLRIHSVGRSLSKACPGARPGVALGELFRLVRPGQQADYDTLRAAVGRLCSLRSHDERLQLRGSIELDADGGLLMLLSPVMTSIEELGAAGLDLDDFAHQDAIADILLIHRTSQLSLEDARRMAQRLKARTDQLGTVLDLSSGGVAYFDAHGAMQYANAALQRLMHLKEPMLPGSRLQELDATLFAQRGLGPDDGAGRTPADRSTLRQLADAAHRGDTALAKVALAHPQPRVLQISASRSPDGGLVIYLRDITAESEVDRLKTEFLTTAAHELRTPMASIFGFTELLLRREFPAARQRDMIQTVHRQAGVMVTLINELLDLARIESRRGADFEIAPALLGDIAHQAVEGLVPADPHAVKVIDDGAATARVWVDAGRIGLALGHVLNNACKFTPAGGEIRLRLAPRVHAGVAGVALRVEDEGIGMSAEQVRRVFERFYRADGSGSIPGTGLGMSIAQEILRLHGGHVEVTSALGRGTQVTLWLPLASKPADQAAQAKPLPA